jgi:hypothetical protein
MATKFTFKTHRFHVSSCFVIFQRKRKFCCHGNSLILLQFSLEYHETRGHMKTVSFKCRFCCHGNSLILLQFSLEYHETRGHLKRLVLNVDFVAMVIYTMQFKLTVSTIPPISTKRTITPIWHLKSTFKTHRFYVSSCFVRFQRKP